MSCARFALLLHIGRYWLGHRHEYKKGWRGNTHVDLINHPRRIRLDFCVGIGKDLYCLDEIVLMPREKPYIEHPHIACFREVDAIRQVSEVVAARGDNCAIAHY